jgi:hypothetical protein
MLSQESFSTSIAVQESVTSVSMPLPREIILWELMHVV